MTAIMSWLFVFVSFAQTTENTLLIFQIGASQSGSNSANVSHSFIELYNAGETPVDLTGYSLQYAEGTRNNHIPDIDAPWQKVDLSGTIQPRHSFLILGNRLSTMPAPALNIANNSGDMNVPGFVLSNRSVKVVLLRNQTLLSNNIQNPFDPEGNGSNRSVDGYVDMIGVTNDQTDRIRGFEGTTSQDGDHYRISQQIGVRRKSLRDTDDNSVDFEAVSYRDVSAEMIEAKRPRNHSYGAWEPILDDDDPPVTDPVLAGEPDELAGKLLILQVYGPNAGAAGASHPFVELYNATEDAIDLSGITLYYADGIRGNNVTKDGTWKTIALTGTIHAKGSFLILGPYTSSAGRLQIANNYGDVNASEFVLSNRAYKIAIIRNTATLNVQNPFDMDGAGAKAAGYIDMVGAANDISHATNPDNIFGYENAPARCSASEAVRRKDLTDTDDNSADFIAARYAADGLSDEEVEARRPKNSGFGPWDPMTGAQKEPGNPAGPAQRITSFKFPNRVIGWEESGYWEGVINQTARTITFTTQRWIENIDKLSAIFELDNEGVVTVNGKSQWSGITQNDFRKDVVYSIGNNHYTVKFVSPQATGLPVIRIDTENAAPIANREDWVTMSFSLTDPNDPENDIATIRDQQIRGRGNASWSNDLSAKNPYRIRFRDNQQQSPFGLAAARNWVLLKVGSEINTPFGFELGKRLDLQYTCTYHPVHLFLNGNYRGTYLFTEHRQADPSVRGVLGRPKVDLNEGWFVEIDRYYSEDPRFRTNDYKLPVMIKSPDAGVNINDPAYTIVKDDLNHLTRLMASDDFPENGYRDLIDIETFAKYFMVQTVVMNNDLFRPAVETGQEIGSTFFYKDKGDKISAGPLWDLDWTFSPWPFTDTWFTGITREFLPNTFPYQIHNWFSRFHDDPVFHARYKEIWNENYHNNILTMTSFVDHYFAKVKAGASEDLKRWRPNDTGWLDWHPGHIKDYFSTRAAYLHGEYNKVDVIPASKDFASDSDTQTFTLVAFGEMTELSATLQNAGLSDFEISAGLSQNPTCKGGYLARISIKPQNSIPAGAYNNVLVLSGRNQGKPFSFEIPLTYTFGSIPDYTLPAGLTATFGQTLADVALPAGWSWMDETLSVGAVGTQIHKAKFTPEDTDNYHVVTNIDVRVTVLALTNSGEFQLVSPLIAWISNGILRISGVYPGETLSVYTSNGAIVYHGIATSNEENIVLPEQGLYIIQSNNRTLRIVFVR